MCSKQMWIKSKNHLTTYRCILKHPVLREVSWWNILGHFRSFKITNLSLAPNMAVHSFHATKSNVNNHTFQYWALPIYFNCWVQDPMIWKCKTNFSLFAISNEYYKVKNHLQFQSNFFSQMWVQTNLLNRLERSSFNMNLSWGIHDIS